MDSMTGFGKAELRTKLGKFTVEISSVNNRFLEIGQRLPKQFFTLEPKVRDLISSKLSRGKVSLYVGFDDNDGSTEQYLINKAALKAYYRQLLSVKKELKASGELSIRDILLLPEVARPEDIPVDERIVWQHLKKVVEKALTELMGMRRKEGQAMLRDMKKRLETVARKTREIKKIAGKAVDMYRDKLTKRLEDLLNAPLPDHLRIEEQIALMAEKTDITEECTRLLSHVDPSRQTLDFREPIGKRLNFVLQEMNREANTIASKSTDARISSIVINVKEEVEKMRELVQNVE